MVQRSPLLGLVLVLVLGGAAQGVLPTDQHDYVIPVPLEMASPTFQQLDAASASRLLPGWDAFVQARGSGWTVAQYRQDLGAPAAVLGPSFPLTEPNADDAVLRDAATRFLTEHAAMLRITPEQLGTPQVIDLGHGKKQLLYGQIYQGLEVVDGRADVFVADGRLVMMGAQFFPRVEVGTTPAISGEQAVTAAIGQIPFNPLTDHVDGTPRLVVYPLVLQGSPTSFLAYEVQFSTENPVGLWLAYVDASDGEVLTRVNNADTFDIPTTVKSDVDPNWEFEPYSEHNSEFHWVQANSQNFYTDQNGFVNLNVPLNQSYPVHSELRGQFVNVNRDDGPDAVWNGQGTPNVPLNIKFDDTNSQASERDGEYSTNRVHNWLKAIDPTFTSLDFALNCNVNLSGSCNAFWNGSSINFYAAGGGCVNMAQISDVVMHEYGHGITQYTYSPSSPPTGSGMGEGLSDCVAMTITNDQYMGRGIHDGSGFIRNGMNTRQYPGSECGAEVHCLGEMLMGAMWKTRLNLTHTYGYTDGKALYDDIFRTTWKTKMRSLPTFLTALLTADDDNADLGDGTPDWYDICDAWIIHNLPCPALTRYISFTHTPLADQASTSNPYEVVSLIQAVNCGTLVADSLRINYSTDGGQNWSNVLLTPTGNPNQFHGFIPAMACGTLVDYYLRARSSTGVTGTDPGRAPLKGTHRFMVGPVTVSLDDNFESNLGWTVGAPGDGATEGFWERVDPTGKTDPYNNEVVQPEDDHTASGTRCFVTDGRGGYFENYDVDGGATTLLSPIFNWSTSHGSGKINLWAFFANESVIDDTLRVSVSNDGGANWTDLVKIKGKDSNAWTNYVAYFSDAQAPFTSQMRFRIQIADFNASLTEGAVDDVKISFTTCTSSGVSDEASIPTRFVVEESRPNPLRGNTSIRFAVPAPSHVSVDLFDAAGRLVRNLASGQQGAGYHSVIWDGRDAQGRPAASGMYYYRVQANGQEQTRKLLVVR